MKNKKPNGLSFTFNDCEFVFSQHSGAIITQKGKVSKMFRNTIISLENGQKLNGYVKPIYEEGKPIDFELYPTEFKKAMNVLFYLGVSSELIDEEPKKKTKGKYVIVKLSDEQEAELKKLKSLC